MKRELRVSIDEETVGTLHENNGIWDFAYAPSWQAHKNGYDLSPALPREQGQILDTGTNRPVQWFFDNLLPEDKARDLLANSVGLNSADAWGMLERFGLESAGAITLLPPGVEQPRGELLPLSNEKLNARIEALPRKPLLADSPKKMSLAGAQDKLPVVLDTAGNLFEPKGSTPSTYILKPDSTAAAYPHSAVNEWFCACLAQELRLSVPLVELRYIPAPIYIIKRFDREITQSGVRRLHVLDATQLLSLSGSMKYEQGGVDSLIKVLNFCRPVVTARISIYRWVVFNLLIGNGDAHLKNFSVFAGPDGYSPTPHYDLVSTGAWDTPELRDANDPKWPDVNLTFQIGNARRFKDVTRADVLAFADALGIPTGLAERDLDVMVNGINDAAQHLANEFEVRTDVPGPMRGSQVRMIRSIIHVPIQTMTKKLGLVIPAAQS